MADDIHMTRPQLTSIGAPRNVREAHLLGFLVDEAQNVYELISVPITQHRGDTTLGNVFGIHVVVHRQLHLEWDDENPDFIKNAEQKWEHPFSLHPWCIERMIQCVNDHQTVIWQQRKVGYSTQKEFNRFGKSIGLKKPTPPPFYIVHLKDSVIRDRVRVKTGHQRSKPGHRYDVRGSYHHRVITGPMPLDPKEELKLEERKYKIYKDRPLDDWAKSVFQKKGMPPRQPGAWVAILEYWHPDKIQGPEDAPYIPSTRRATKGPLAFDNRPRKSKNDDEAA